MWLGLRRPSPAAHAGLQDKAAVLGAGTPPKHPGNHSTSCSHGQSLLAGIRRRLPIRERKDVLVLWDRKHEVKMRVLPYLGIHLYVCQNLCQFIPLDGNS